MHFEYPSGLVDQVLGQRLVNRRALFWEGGMSLKRIEIRRK